MLKFAEGDLFASHRKKKFHALAHGCNCQGSMGAGIAAVFKRMYPYMYDDYKEFCNKGLLNPGDVYLYTDAHGDPPHRETYVFNMLTQREPGPHAQLEWVESACQEVLRQATVLDVTSIGMPMIGCGIGGLDDGDVKSVMVRVFDASPIQVVVFDEFVPHVAVGW